MNSSESTLLYSFPEMLAPLIDRRGSRGRQWEKNLRRMWERWSKAWMRNACCQAGEQKVKEDRRTWHIAVQQGAVGGNPNLH